MERKCFGRGRGRLTTNKCDSAAAFSSASVTTKDSNTEDETSYLSSPMSPCSMITTTSICSSSSKGNDRSSESYKSGTGFVFPNNTEADGEEETSELDEEVSKKTTAHGHVPKTKSEAAHEFRMDSELSATPIARHFFCWICGCPAGHDCFTCENLGHPLCQLCKNELKLEECQNIVEKESGTIKVCGSKLLQFRSYFRELMYEKTIVGCLYRSRGCEFKGPWNIVKEHQNACKHSGNE